MKGGRFTTVWLTAKPLKEMREKGRRRRGRRRRGIRRRKSKKGYVKRKRRLGDAGRFKLNRKRKKFKFLPV